MHEGHRERMRHRIAENGLDSLTDHEVLEYLLYFIHTRGNTNDIAHRLLDAFKSFHKVLDADVEALMEVKGVGYATAQFLTELPALLRRYERGRRDGGIRFFSVASVVDWLVPLYYGAKGETTVVLCLDADYNLIHEKKWDWGSHKEAPVNVREIVSVALKYNAAKIIFSHNHLTNMPRPSGADAVFTADCKVALERMQIELMDHIIVCPNGQYYSFRQEQRL